MNINDIKLRILRFKRIILRLQKMWTGWRNASKKVYFYHRIPEYREMWRTIAEKEGAKFSVLSDDIWEIELNGKRTRIFNHQMEFDNPVTLGLASMKPLMHRLLKEKGISVPEHVVFRLSELNRAYEFLRQYPAGCVIKPANGTHAGDGVTTHIMSKKEARKAAILASLYCPDLLMEPQIPGECYRLLVLGGKMVHAVRRSGPRLYGDGVSKISDLIKAENERLKKRNKDILKIDCDCLFTLSWQNLSLDSIPQRDQVFIVKSVNDPLGRNVELRTVYNETVTDLICDSVRKSAEMAAKILNSDFVGVDLIMTDPSVPLEESGGVINEINTTPALHHHYDIRVDKYPEPAVEALSLLLKRAHSV